MDGVPLASSVGSLLDLSLFLQLSGITEAL